MPRDPSKMERIQEPIWDTLIQGTPGAFVPRANITGGPFPLYTGAIQANLTVSNMETPGVLPGTQTYLLLAMRTWLYFQGCTIGGDIQYDFVMYHHAVLRLYWQLNIDQKRYFVAPTWYLNSGGGLCGDVGNTTDVYFTNGTPGAKDIMTLDRPIPLVRQQPFNVQCTVAAVGVASLAADIAGLLNGEVNIQFMLDGLKLRDVL
ncbi:MAG: hypothetical protein ABIO70_15945 [Pseudomonadota bacterium]